MVDQRRCGKQKRQMFWAAFGYGIKTELVTMEGDPEAARGGFHLEYIAKYWINI
jgi:hypothetical protein